VTLTSSTNKSRVTRKILGIAIAFLTLAIPFFLMIQYDTGHIDQEQSLCPFKLLTGFPCPGCGITKSLICIYKCDILNSLSYHIFGPFIWLLCIAVIIVLTTELITGKEYFVSITYSKKIAYFLGITLAIYHLIRLVYFVYSNSFDEILRQSVWK
jgi:hypothetical protein